MNTQNNTLGSWNELTERYISNIFIKLKEARVKLFIEKLNLGPKDTVLDLGSEDGSYLAMFYPYRSNIHLADIRADKMDAGVKRYGLGGYTVIKENEPLPFADRQFSAVWCNSVIEHVTINKTNLCNISNQDFIAQATAHQSKFANEIKRVARKYFVQTPNIHYPIESHSCLPLIPYLTQQQRCILARILKKIWIKQWSADFYLYNLPRYKQDFDDASEFIPEKTFGITKSLIALRNN